MYELKRQARRRSRKLRGEESDGRSVATVTEIDVPGPTEGEVAHEGGDSFEAVADAENSTEVITVDVTTVSEIDLSGVHVEGGSMNEEVGTPAVDAEKVTRGAHTHEKGCGKDDPREGEGGTKVVVDPEAAPGG